MNSLKIVGILAILWNLFGVFMFYGSTQVGLADLVTAYGQEGGELMYGRPSWTKVAFGVATIAGLIGSIVLLLGKSWSRLLFALSLIGIIANNVWSFTSGMFSHALTSDKVMMPIIFLVAVALLWYAHKKTQEGVLT